MKGLRARANAKINLALAVTGIRDDGYHLLDTIMQSVSVYDTISVSRSKRINVTCDKAPSGEENIAFRAAQAFFSVTGVSGGAEICIDKGIPVAAGLGGGSSDAAAVLQCLDRVYDTRLSYERLCSIALTLGADVPFCINGGTARVGGIGEIITPLKPLCECAFVLASAGEKPSTGEMYRRLDMADCENPDVGAAAAAVNEKDYIRLCRNMGNSFSAVWKYSELSGILSGFGADAVSVSGSGPAVFGIFGGLSEAMDAVAALDVKKIGCLLAAPEKKGIITE